MAPRQPSALAALAKLALLLGSLLLVAAGAEIALRLTEHEPAPSASVSVDPELRTLRTVLELAKPNQRGIFKGLPFRTNSHGFRGPELAIEKPENTLRVVVIGDSVTMGSGVLEESAYPALLAQRLAPSLHGMSVQVINLGVSGLDLRSSLARLENIGLRFDPDLVVYGWTINDLESKGYRTKRGQRPFQSLTKSRSHLARWLAERLRATLPNIASLPGSYLAELDDNYFSNAPVWHGFETDLDRLAQVTRANQVCAVVFLHGVLHSLGMFHPYDRFYDTVTSAATSSGLTVVTSIDHLRGHDERELRLSDFDTHPNAAGHRILADALADGIMELPPSCWPPLEAN